MGNCLKTQLKEAVNNDNLEYLGIIMGTDNNTTYPTIKAKSGGTVTLELLDGNTFYDGTNSVTSTGTAINKKFEHNTEARMKVTNKYDLEELQIKNLQIKNFNVFSTCVYLKILIIGNSRNIEGDLGVFNNCPLLETLNLQQATGFTGKMSELGKLANLKIMLITNQHRGVTGTVEDFVNAQIAVGRAQVAKADALTMGNAPFWATLGGQAISTTIYTFLTWESASKIAYFNSSTYNNIESAESVVAKGYSAEEIASKQAVGGDWEGLTVYDVSVKPYVVYQP